MADQVIMTPGVMYGDLMAEAMSLVGKGGTCVVTGVAPITQTEAAVNLFELTMWKKEIKGTIFGSLNPRARHPEPAVAVPRAASSSWTSSITKTYSLDEINDGYQDMRDGKNIRGVIVF